MTTNRNLTILVPLLFIGAFLLWYDIYLPPKPGSDVIVEFTVEKGESAKEISIKLEEKGLIKNAFIFRCYALIKGFSGKLQSGWYELSPAMNMPKISKKIAFGDVAKEKITTIEGWNLKEIADYFEEKKICDPEEFLTIAKKDFNSEFAFLKDKPKNLNLEGYLFPDTYYIKKQRTENKKQEAEDIVRQMLANFDKKLNSELREVIVRQNKSIFEIITMASLIEKEVRTPEDKKIVSGILWKRLKAGKPLESCATIAYILGVNKWRYSFDDTRLPSPYNTYLNSGLPLGPISNPGLDSILAAIYPEKSDFWFYLSTPEGKTIFSKTLGEHNVAKAKYLK